MVARIDSSSYHYWTQKEGADCWHDKSFMDAYLRDNPQARVKSGGTKFKSVTDEIQSHSQEHRPVDRRR